MKSEDEVRAAMDKARSEADKYGHDEPVGQELDLAACILAWVLGEDDNFAMSDMGLV